MKCAQISEQTVDYLYGGLSDSERREFQAHLTGCASCQAEVEGLGGTLGRVRTALAGPLAQEAPSRVRVEVLKAAAAAAGSARVAPAPAVKVGERFGWLGEWLRRPWFLPAFGVAAVVGLLVVSRETAMKAPVPHDEEPAPAASPVVAPAPAEPTAAQRGQDPEGPREKSASSEAQPKAKDQELRDAEPLGGLVDRPVARKRPPVHPPAIGLAPAASKPAPAKVAAPDRAELGAAESRRWATPPPKAKARAYDDDLDSLSKGEAGVAHGVGSLAGPGAGRGAATGGGALNQKELDRAPAEERKTAAPAPREDSYAAPPPPRPARVAPSMAPPARSMPPPAPSPPPMAEPPPPPAPAAPAAPPAMAPPAGDSGDATAGRRSRAATKKAPAPSAAAEAERSDDQKQSAPADEARADKRDEGPEGLVRTAERLFAEQRWAQAVVAYRELLRRFPEHTDARLWRQRVEAAQKAQAR